MHVQYIIGKTLGELNTVSNKHCSLSWHWSDIYSTYNPDKYTV